MVSRNTQSAQFPGRLLFAKRFEKRTISEKVQTRIQFRKNVVADIKMNYGDNRER